MKLMGGLSWRAHFSLHSMFSLEILSENGLFRDFALSVYEFKFAHERVLKRMRTCGRYFR